MDNPLLILPPNDNFCLHLANNPPNLKKNHRYVYFCFLQTRDHAVLWIFTIETSWVSFYVNKYACNIIFDVHPVFHCKNVPFKKITLCFLEV